MKLVVIFSVNLFTQASEATVEINFNCENLGFLGCTYRYKILKVSLESVEKHACTEAGTFSLKLALLFDPEKVGGMLYYYILYVYVIDVVFCKNVICFMY